MNYILIIKNNKNMIEKIYIIYVYASQVMIFVQGEHNVVLPNHFS